MTFKVRENVPLAELTTLKIGGAARFFVSAQSESDAAEALKFADRNELKVFILGGGSNVLIADAGFDGLVLQTSLKGISVLPDKNRSFHVTAQAGEDWDAFVEFCVQRNLQGIECLSGIPGFVGGTPVQNVGAYGQEVSDTIVAAKVMERATGRVFVMDKSECDFAYRASIFNTSKRNCYIVLSVTFCLIENNEPNLIYKDLQNYFGSINPNLQETRDAVLQIRRAKSMVIDPADSNSKSAGSFFKNPIVSLEKFAEIESRARNLKLIGQNETIPQFPIDANHLKIPAAWLIEKSGFYKGYKLNNTVGLSTRHTLAIVNLGNARATDVLKLKDLIQTEVKKNFAVELLPEPIFAGF